MTEFTLFDETNAPEGSRAILEGAKKQLGFVPNLYAAFSASPPVLEAYTTLSGLLGKTSFSPTEQQVVMMTANFEHNCEYCMAAHSVISKMQDVPADVLDALRTGAAIPDAKLEALRVFTRAVLQERGWVSKDTVETFLAAGYTQANVLDVILGLAIKTLSNYTNHIVETRVDDAFVGQAWTKPE
ncbi:MAG: carboxymuconolactone decarboxylase family protein [Maricaulaceae bacterium]